MSQHQLQYRIGANSAGTNTWTPGYGSKPHGDLVVAQGKGKYYESAMRGRVFSFYLNATSSTIAAGNIEAATGANTTQFALWNPAASGINIVLLKFGMGIVSGTPAPGAVTHSITTTVPTVTSVAATNVPLCHNLSTTTCGAGYLSSVAGTTLTGGGALKVLRVSDFSSTATAQGSVGAVKAVEDLNGDIILPPGTCWVPTWRTAGSSLLNAYSITWEEIVNP